MLANQMRKAALSLLLIGLAGGCGSVTSGDADAGNGNGDPPDSGGQDGGAASCPVGQVGERDVGSGCVDAGGLLLWLDGADPLADRTPPANGASVVSWVDRSGNEHHADQADPDKRPTYVASAVNGRGVVRFDSEDPQDGNELDIDNSGGEFDLTDATLFVVLRHGYDDVSSENLLPVAPGFFAVRDGGAGADTRVSLHVRADAAGWGIWNGIDFFSTDEPDFGGKGFLLVDATWENDVETLRTDGKQVFSGTHPWNENEVMHPVRIGWSGNSNEHFDGDIAEVILFDNALDQTERDAVAEYLAEKWGIELDGDD